MGQKSWAAATVSAQSRAVTERLRPEVLAVRVPGSHDRRHCLAGLAIRVAHHGTHRLAAVQLAERALSSGDCGSDPGCVQHAVLTLVYAIRSFRHRAL